VLIQPTLLDEACAAVSHTLCTGGAHHQRLLLEPCAYQECYIQYTARDPYSKHHTLHLMHERDLPKHSTLLPAALHTRLYALHSPCLCS
jgi:hypothetical protein